MATTVPGCANSCLPLGNSADDITTDRHHMIASEYFVRVLRNTLRKSIKQCDTTFQQKLDLLCWRDFAFTGVYNWKWGLAAPWLGIQDFASGSMDLHTLATTLLYTLERLGLEMATETLGFAEAVVSIRRLGREV